MLVTIRVVPDVGRLRKRHLYRAVRMAMCITVRRQNFRICDISVQGNHVHLIVEADDTRALSRGMQGFQVSAAKRINGELVRHGIRRRGQVFADRFHAVELSTPRQVRNARAYVLGNWRRHREDRCGGGGRYDRFSNAGYTDGWLGQAPFVDLLGIPDVLPVKFPRTWLLSQGWRIHGLLDPWSTPGPS